MNHQNLKKTRKNFDGIDSERYEGVFLPLNNRPARKKFRDVKEFLLENIETVLDEIIEDLDVGKNK